MKPEATLRVEALGQSYNGRRALTDVNISVLPGRVTILLGPNGAGKTTLFSLVARLMPIQTGSINLCGADLATASDHILASLGIVFQQQTLDLDLSVAQNLAYYAALHGLSRQTARQRSAAALERLGLAGSEKDKVRQLNGGHRRRVEIARVLMTKPRLLLLDEPTVGLDIPTRRLLVDFLHQLAVEDGIAVLWATHLADEVAGHDDLIILAKGRILRTGTARGLVAAEGSAGVSAYFESVIEKERTVT